MANKNGTHITFSWDIVDGYYNSSDITFFQLYYQHRTSTHSQHIYYSSAYRNGATFSYTRPLEIFNNGPYIMWVWMHRRFIFPYNSYSERKYVKIGKLDLERP